MWYNGASKGKSSALPERARRDPRRVGAALHVGEAQTLRGVIP